MAPKTTMSRRPHTKFGTAMPSVPSDTAPDSSQLRRRHTEQAPSRTPPPVARTRAVTASSSVAGSRSTMTRSASCWSQSERPKLPRQRLRKKAPYWAHQEPVRPNSRRTRSMSSAVEPTGAIRSAGSPGRIRRIANTSTLTPQSESTARKRRLSRKRRDITKARLSGLAASMSTIGRTLAQLCATPLASCVIGRQRRAPRCRRAREAYPRDRCSPAPCLSTRSFRSWRCSSPSPCVPSGSRTGGSPTGTSSSSRASWGSP